MEKAKAIHLEELERPLGLRKNFIKNLIKSFLKRKFDLYGYEVEIKTVQGDITDLSFNLI